MYCRQREVPKAVRSRRSLLDPPKSGPGSHSPSLRSRSRREQAPDEGAKPAPRKSLPPRAPFPRPSTPRRSLASGSPIPGCRRSRDRRGCSRAAPRRDVDRVNARCRPEGDQLGDQEEASLGRVSIRELADAEWKQRERERRRGGGHGNDRRRVRHRRLARRRVDVGRSRGEQRHQRQSEHTASLVRRHIERPVFDDRSAAAPTMAPQIFQRGFSHRCGCVNP